MKKESTHSYFTEQIQRLNATKDVVFYFSWKK